LFNQNVPKDGHGWERNEQPQQIIAQGYVRKTKAACELNKTDQIRRYRFFPDILL
jgi:hypothetical protein